MQAWRIGAMIVAAVAVASVTALSLRDGAGSSAGHGNLPDNAVVARLAMGSEELPAAYATAIAAHRASPNDRESALALARLHLDEGRRMGDARYAGAALSVLTPWIEDGRDPSVLNLAASARQYRHDFAGALELLDRVLGQDPANAQARLSRANIRVVQGRLGDAAQDCPPLAAARRMDLAILCVATVNALGANATATRDQLEVYLRSGRLDPALVGYAHSLLAEMAWFNQDHEIARAYFDAAVRQHPDDVRTRLIFADFLLSQNEPQRALNVLEPLQPSDSVQVRRVISLKALGRESEAAPIRHQLAEDFERQKLVGESAHAREQARFWLHAEGDAKRALAAAERNWTQQRELEDARLMIEAAQLAGAPEAAAPVIQWANDEGVNQALLSASMTSHAGGARP